MWVDIKTLATAIGKTPRAVQLMIKRDLNIVQRKRDGKSYEVYVPSLPAEYQASLAKNGALISNSTTLPALAASAQLVSKPEAMISIGAKLTEKQRQRLLIANKIKQRPAGKTKTEWDNAVAAYYGVSLSTIRRIETEIETFGVTGRQRHSGRQSSWDIAAIEYLRGYYLQAMKETGSCSKTSAWLRTQKEAQDKGWRIGSRSSAFNLLGEISPVMIAYAQGGNRALDNYFYIARDADALDPMQIIIGDQHIFDWWIADYETGLIRRPECYLWIDMCTKLIYGIAFAKKYNSSTVRDALRFGLRRFGKFQCTYNDNGAPECSKAITSMIDDLLIEGMQAADISDLYKTADGNYVVLNDKDEIQGVAVNEHDWKRQNRRIFANVKNAKAKDIERFFRTLERRLDDRNLPGKCATPGADAAVDEVERARLEYQKEKRLLLTEEQFIQVVAEELDAYENARHATLKMSPWQKLEEKEQNGWNASWLSDEKIDLITAERRHCKVQQGRILIDGIWYWSEEVSARAGEVQDIGLWRYDGQRVEIRYHEHKRDIAFAIIAGSARPLVPVKKIAMLDNQSMVEAISTKRTQMAAIRDAVHYLTKPIGSVIYRPSHKEAPQEVMAERPDTPKKLLGSKKTKDTMMNPPIHLSKRERYDWCLEMLRVGTPLTQTLKIFMTEYREGNEYKHYEEYWKSKEALIGGI